MIMDKTSRCKVLQLRRGRHTRSQTKSSTSFKFYAILILASNFRSLALAKWAVEIQGGSRAADEVARAHNCKNLGLLKGSSDIFLFEPSNGPDTKRQLVNRDLNSPEMVKISKALEEHPAVNWVHPQHKKQTRRRDLLSWTSSLRGSPFDFGFNQQVTPGGSSGRIPIALKLPVEVSDELVLKHDPTGSVEREIHSVTHASQERAIHSGTGLNSGFPIDPKNLNDELWRSQWYLRNDDVPKVGAQIAKDGEVRLNVEDVWRMGFTGRGVVVTIIDDGLEHNHTDIKDNYDERASYDYNENDPDPFPRYDRLDSNSHGTRCAGEIAMVGNNKKCGVGIAPGVRIGGIKLLDTDHNREDHLEYSSLLHNIDHIDIYSSAWGPQDDGTRLEGPDKLAQMALKQGIRDGRQGRGALYIWANGNGGTHGDNCACDGYCQSIYTISIGAASQHGQLPIYGERCSSTLAVTVSSGGTHERRPVTTDLHNKCTSDFTGTSAAAPLAAGIFALVLEANPNITWRDAQHLVSWTANPIPLRHSPGWKQNGAGFLFNNRFGFGLLDAKAIVTAALTWKTVPKKSTCIVHLTGNQMNKHIRSGETISVTFKTDGCQHESMETSQFWSPMMQRPRQLQQQPPPPPSPLLPVVQSGPIGIVPAPQVPLVSPQLQPTHPISPVNFLEHVEVKIDLHYSRRGSIDIFLISPSGTTSTLMTPRHADYSREGFIKWNLMSVHFWGERSQGEWTLIVRDKQSLHNRGSLRNATLYLHGTSVLPAHMTEKRRPYKGTESLIMDFLDPVPELDQINTIEVKKNHDEDIAI